MTDTILFDTNKYSVVQLDEPIPIENNGVKLHFFYGVLNKDTGCMEGYSQFLPSAIEQSQVLNDTLTTLLEVEVEDEGADITEPDGNVIPLEIKE